MKYLFISVISLIIFSCSTTEEKIEVEESNTILEFVNIHDDLNLPFYYNRGLNYMKVIGDDVLKTNVRSFDREKSLEVPLTKSEIYDIFTEKPKNEEHDAWLYDGHDFKILCFEKIIGINQGIKYKQITWVHFYTEEDLYKFSISFKDFIKLVEQQKEIYIKNTNDLLWKNDLLLTHGNYTDDFQDFHRKNFSKVMENEEFKIIDYSTQKKINKQDLNPFLSPNYYHHSLFVKDSLVNGNMQISSLGYQNIYEDYLPNKQYYFDWEYVKPQHKNNTPIFKLEDAFINELYHTYKTKSIRTSNANIYPYNKSIIPYKGILKTHFLEAVILSQSENKVFHTVYPNFVEDLINSTMNEKITAYNSSLTSSISLQEFDLHRSKILSYKYKYYPYSDYSKNDTVTHTFYKYRAKQDIIGVGDTSEILDSILWEILPNDHYLISEIEDLECSFKMQFDENGNHVKLDLESITIFISYKATGNIRGIQWPIASYKWKDIKKVFPNPEFIKFMENRKYFSYFLKTDIVKPF